MSFVGTVLSDELMSTDLEQSGEQRVGKNLLGTFPFNVNADHDHHHNHQQVHHRHQGSFDLALPGPREFQQNSNDFSRNERQRMYF